MKNTIVVFALLAISFQLAAQKTASDSLYYKDWVGEWYKDVDGNIESNPTFVVKRGLYNCAFEEYWMGAGGDFSIAWRAWDTRTQKWDFAWMSTDGLFQLWEGEKVNATWYMFKSFVINGNVILSRQAFIPEGKNQLIRTSEHSADDGKTWKLRFKEVYRRKLTD